jgi:hypothetical protein
VATELFANTPSTTVSSGGNTAPSAGTVETWTVASSSLFPSASAALGTQFHVADPVFPRELVAVTNVSGTTWTVTRGAESTPTFTHGTGFTVTQVVSAGWLGSVGLAAPYVFIPEAYGAVGDGKVAGDAAITSGQAVVTSVAAGFSSADVGKTLMFNGALSSTGTPLIATINSVNPGAHQATLSANAAATVSSGGQIFWATDDTTAISNCVTAAANYATTATAGVAGSGNYYAQVQFSSKFYGLASGPTQTGNGSSTPTFNSQIPVPYPATNTVQKLVIELAGAGNSSQLQFWESTVPNMQGTCLVSLVKAPSQPDATFGWQSVIGGPTGGAGFTGGYANMKIVVSGISVVVPVLTQQHAYDFRFVSQMNVSQSSAQPFTSVLGNAPKLTDLPGLGFFQSRGNVGLYSPVVGNNDDLWVDSFAVEGFEIPVAADDHFTAGRIAILYGDVGLLVNATGGLSGQSNAVSIANLSVEQTNSAIVANGGQVPVYINLTAEGINTWDVNDGSNNLAGFINYSNTAGAAPNVNGAANVTISNTTGTATRLGQSVAPKTFALTDAATIAVNAQNGNLMTVTLGGNRTLGNPSNPVDGQQIVFVITQDGGGSRTLAYASAYAFSTSLPSPTLSTGSGAVDYLEFIYSAAASKWRFVSFISGF